MRKNASRKLVLKAATTTTVKVMTTLAEIKTKGLTTSSAISPKTKLEMYT
jgi:hypothetical protein